MEWVLLLRSTNNAAAYMQQINLESVEIGCFSWNPGVVVGLGARCIPSTDRSLNRSFLWLGHPKEGTPLGLVPKRNPISLH